MPDFVHPMLLWGLLLIAVPVVIHLINLLRQRRVDWAAMEFLLASQKKHSRWIRLKELLLLLLRVAAVAAVVVVLARPATDRRWGALFGGTPTHHVVLIDDSFSMGDRGSVEVFDVAKQSVRQIADRLAREPAGQLISVLRFSQAATSDGPAKPDFLQEPILSVHGGASSSTAVAGDQRLEAALESMRPSFLAVGPGEALSAVDDLFGPPADEQRVVYLVSDFRANQWGDAAPLVTQLKRLAADGTRLELIDCAEHQRPNLAISSLHAASGSLAAGVPVFLEVAVHNYSEEPARQVAVRLEEDGRTRPPLVIDEVPAGEAVARRFQVQFATSGYHDVTARLESDAVAADNVRHLALDLPMTVPVLVVDGDPDALDAEFITRAIAPGGAVNTGITPQIERPTYLARQPLARFRAIYLANVERLDPAAVEAIETYVRDGGGLAVFVGPRTDPVFVNEQLWRDGEGWFPLPLLRPTDLLLDSPADGPHLEVTDHPLFRIFAGERNSFLASVAFERYLAARPGWQPEPESGTQVIARLRNGAPLVVEQRLGAGRVLAFLSTAAPVWNNWGRNPSFVVTMLELQNYLAPHDAEQPQYDVGSPLVLELDPTRHSTRVSFMLPRPADLPAAEGFGDSPRDAPGDVGGDAVTTASTAGLDDGMQTFEADAESTATGLEARLTETARPGFYAALLTTNDGNTETRNYVFNVDSSEGNLARVTSEQLAARLKGVPYRYHAAGTLTATNDDAARFALGDLVLYLLVGLIVGEQLLAYAASYHPRSAGGGRS